MSPPPWGSSCLLQTLSASASTWPAPVAHLPMFLNSGFHHRNLASSAQPDPPSCQQAGALPGSVPGPESHSQTPAASKLGNTPELFYLPDSLLPHSRRAQPSAPLLASTGLPRHPRVCWLQQTISDPQNSPQTTPPFFPLLLGLFITRKPGIPFSKCLLVT